MGKERNVCLVVLGDIGRSPRMQYHACSLLKQNINVDFIGYLESRPMPQLHVNKCKLHGLRQMPNFPLPSVFMLIYKTIWQALTLLIVLLSIRKPDLLLIQNPPGIPTLIICYLYCRVLRCKFLIDWHNYTYTILALNTRNGLKSTLCRMAKWLEQHFGSKADGHFCVTKAMQKDLTQKWHINNVTVLYDRPSSQFHPIGVEEKWNIFLKLAKDYPKFLWKNGNISKNRMENNFIQLNDNIGDKENFYHRDKTAVLVSSTSWTSDEDFSILLKALQEYEQIANREPGNFPPLLCIITGKGPQKEYYSKKISELHWSKVNVITPWLEIEDYPKVLAAADLGVSLHYSSSGLDLPMKVIDMFGCGLPVCAYNFHCLNELVRHNENSFVFDNAEQLSEQLQFWFRNFPNNYNQKQREIKRKFQKNLQEYQNLRWHNNWLNTAWPVFHQYIK